VLPSVYADIPCSDLAIDRFSGERKASIGSFALFFSGHHPFFVEMGTQITEPDKRDNCCSRFWLGRVNMGLSRLSTTQAATIHGVKNDGAYRINAANSLADLKNSIEADIPTWISNSQLSRRSSP
jgi:hypothetical protein